MTVNKGRRLAHPMIAASLLLGVGLSCTTAYAQSGRGGDQSFSGQIGTSSPSEEGRRYQVRTMHLEAGRRYGISATSADFDTKIRLSFADDNDEPLADDDDGGDGTNSYLEFIPHRTGTHRIRVTSFNDNLGNYALGVKALAPLPALLRPAASSTSRIEFRHFSGELTQNDAVVRNRRVDDYGFRFEAGKQVFIYMDRVGDTMDPHLSVFAGDDRSGNKVIASDDDGGDELNAFLSFVPEVSGEYIVRASSAGEDGAQGKYELRVGQQP